MKADRFQSGRIQRFALVAERREREKERERERVLATWSNSMDWILRSWMMIESRIWGLSGR